MATERKPREIPSLTGLRGVAALLVIITHYWFWARVTPVAALPSSVEPWTATSDIGMAIFFTLSGFVIAQMKNWFGPVVGSWRYLRSYRIPHAQPQQYPGTLEPPQRPVRVRPGVYVCGDHRDNASIQGAMLSGRRAGEAVVADLAR